jgi:16S rRNA (guanine527-N7)-methyltransferase
VLALLWPGSAWTLLDANRRRAHFLERAAARLGCRDRLRVLCERAEIVGRTATERGAYSLIVARGFGPPGVTTECAAPLLRVGGRLVVSEPPGAADARWPQAALEELGLESEGAVRAEAGSYRVLLQTFLCPDRYPRRVGVPGKRPRF